MQRTTRTLVLALASLVFLCGTGCGDNTGTVTGTVSLEGEAITWGTVTFIGADGRVATANIQPDASYRVVKVPLGEAVVTVQTYPLPPQVRPPDAPPEKSPSGGLAGVGEMRFVPIHAVYADPKRSPLRCPIEAGTRTHDLKLKKSGM